MSVNEKKIETYGLDKIDKISMFGLDLSRLLIVTLF